MTAGERVCAECGERIGPGAGFCRNCGARYVEPEPPAVEEERLSEPEPTTPTCPRCGAELAPSAAFCRSCGTPVGDPGPPTEVVEPAAPPLHEPDPAPPPAAPATPPPSGEGRSRRRVALIVGALVLVVGAGVAVALLATQKSHHTVTTTIDLGTSPRPAASEEEPGGEVTEAEEAPVETFEEPEEVEPEETTEEPEPEEEAEGEEVNTSSYPEVPRAEMNDEVASVLKRYHEDVVEEDFQGAWATLSRRKRRQDLREYGYHKWASAQVSLSPYLDPYGLEAKIVALEGEGVARVEVTGMGWNAPGASCSEWSGLTWMKYEGGSWAYDPGYSTTAARRNTWRSKSDRLLGGDC